MKDTLLKIWNFGSSTFDKYPLKSVIAILSIYIIATWSRVWGGC